MLFTERIRVQFVTIKQSGFVQ